MRPNESGPGAGHTKAALDRSIANPNDFKLAQPGKGLKGIPAPQADHLAHTPHDLVWVAASRLQRRLGLAWSTALVNAHLAGFGGRHE